jgi:urease accessory protein
MATEGLYSLLQITDSLFPSGAFAHSGGLEGLFDRRDTPHPTELPIAIREVFFRQLLRVDGLLGMQAHRAMRDGELEEVYRLDRELFAMKLTREVREGSVATGGSFLGEASRIFQHPPLDRLREIVESGNTPGNYSIVFHAVAATLGVAEQASLLAWGYQTIAQMTAVLLRLGVLGHRAAQSLLAGMRPDVEAGVAELLRSGADGPTSFAPQLDIASMRHERQYSRLFRS